MKKVSFRWGNFGDEMLPEKAAKARRILLRRTGILIQMENVHPAPDNTPNAQQTPQGLSEIFSDPQGETISPAPCEYADAYM
jgi:hypothetical protein